jgi:type I restriction enzyme S subunit
MTVREPFAQYLTATRRTELGKLPIDWDVVPLGAFEPFVTSGSRGWADYYSDIGSPFLRITNLSRSRIYPSLKDLRHVAVPLGNNEGMRTALKAGDILISITADIGIIGLVTDEIDLPAYVNQHIALVRLVDRDVSSRYIAYFLAAAAAQRRFKSMTDAGAKAGMNLAGIREVLVAIPPTTGEQGSIAAALTDADALIDSLEQLLAKKRQIKQGAMQELLTSTRRLPGFSGDWDEVALGTLLHSRPDYGINAPAVRYTPSLPTYLRITDIDDEGRFLANSAMSVNRPDAELYYLNPGDVVFARTGASVGKSYLHKDSVGRLVFAGFLIRAQPIVAKLVPAYLFYFSQTRRYWKWVTLMSMRSGQPGINGQELATMPIPLPQIDEQHAIASVLEDLDAEIDTLEARLAKARHVKQAMAQALLTGRIRLMDPDT